MKFLTELKNKVIDNLYILVIILLAFLGIKLITNFKSVINLYLTIKNLLAPVILGAIIAYALNPILKLIERNIPIKKGKRGLSLLLTYVFILIIIVLCFIYIVPSIVSNIKQLIGSIPDFVSAMETIISKYIGNDTARNWLESTDVIKTASTWVTGIFNTLLASLVTITSSLIKWVLAFVISIYFLYDKEKFIKSSKKLVFLIFKEKHGKSILELLKQFNKMIGAYIGARAIASLIISVLSFSGLLMFKAEYVLLITVFAGITNMIPYFGPALGMILAFALNVFYNPGKAIGIVLWFVFIQQIDANILDPKLSGNKVGIHPITCIVALAFGGAIYGIIGMVLAVPIAGVIKLYLVDFMHKYDKKHPEISALIDE